MRQTKEEVFNIGEQIGRIVSFFEQRLKEENSKEKIKVACIINDELKMTRQFAYPSEWADGYTSALETLQEKCGFKNTIYELYTDNVSLP